VRSATRTAVRFVGAPCHRSESRGFGHDRTDGSAGSTYPVRDRLHAAAGALRAHRRLAGTRRADSVSPQSCRATTLRGGPACQTAHRSLLGEHTGHGQRQPPGCPPARGPGTARAGTVSPRRMLSRTRSGTVGAHLRRLSLPARGARRNYASSDEQDAAADEATLHWMDQRKPV
jgi:hypothetical protein